MKLGGLSAFMRDVTLGQYILIIGSGPSAKAVSAKDNPKWGCLAKGHSTILVNGAPDVEGADVYMAFDKNCYKYPWYREGRAKHYLIGVELAKLKPPACDYYTFEYQPTLHRMMGMDFSAKGAGGAGAKWDRLHDPKVLHGGGTVTCCAYQLAMRYNPKVINLIGVEMTNGIWWDKEEGNASRERHGIQPMNMLIRYANDAMGIRTFHIGATRLSCQEVDAEVFYD